MTEPDGCPDQRLLYRCGAHVTRALTINTCSIEKRALALQLPRHGIGTQKASDTGQQPGLSCASPDVVMSGKLLVTRQFLTQQLREREWRTHSYGPGTCFPGPGCWHLQRCPGASWTQTSHATTCPSHQGPDAEVSSPMESCTG